MNHYQTAAFVTNVKMKLLQLHPPTVIARCPPKALVEFDYSNEYVAQIKFGGTHVMIHTNGKEVEITNTHGQRMTLLEKHPNIDFKGLAATETSDFTCYPVK